jgi:hypothetical protein
MQKKSRMQKKTPSKDNLKANELSPPKLVLPEPIRVPTHKKVKSEMDLFSEHSSKFEKYIGHIDIGNLYYIYLLNKYRSKCLIYDLTGADSSDYSAIGLTISTSLEQSVMDNLFIHMQNVAKLLSDCIKNGSDTVIIPLCLRFGNASSGHSNLLIYRKSDNTIERFEPHGSRFIGYIEDNEDIVEDETVTQYLDDFCTMVNEEFDKHNIPHIRFKNASEVCPTLYGIQRLEDANRVRGENEGGGYCQLWSMFFAELVLNNSTIPSDELLSLVLQNVKGPKGQEYLIKIAKGYSYHISTKLEKYFSILFDEKDLYSKLTRAEITFSPQFRKKFAKYLFYLAKIEMMANMDPNFNAETNVKLITDRLIFARGEYNKIQLDKTTKKITNVNSPTKQMRSASVVSTPLRLENHPIPTLILRSGIDQKTDEDNFQKMIESLEAELAVYSKLDVLKNPSLGREYKSRSKSKSNKSKENTRDSNDSTEKLKQMLDVGKTEVVMVK